MGEKVKVNVRGIHRDAQGNEMVSETVAFGEYYERGGSHYVLYEETLEEEGESIRTMIKIKEPFLELTRKGSVNTKLIFEKGELHRTSYQTPYGLMEFDVKTHQMDCRRMGKHMDISMEYDLLSGEEKIGSYRLEISVT